MNGEQVAVKVLKPIKPKKILREAKILKAVKGGPNILKFIDLIKDEETGETAFVTEFIETAEVHLRKIKKSFTEEDVRFYMYQILKALDHANSMGIMHRDIKPRNIAIDHPNRKLYLLDWGLAEFYHPGQRYHSNVSALHF